MINDIQIHRTFVHTRITFKNSEIEGRITYKTHRHFVKKNISIEHPWLVALSTRKKKTETLEKFTPEKSAIGTGELFAALFIITDDN